LRGEFESTKAIYAIDPDFTNHPLGWGSFRDTPDTHFYLCAFRTLSEDVPDTEPFCGRLAALHRDSVSPNGKFGFHVVTYNGNLPQDNSYTDTWEECFSNGLRRMLALNLKTTGPSELQDLAPVIFEKVIPRLLRPMETNGRSVKPSLVHGDLWYGNVADDLDLDKPVVFDPCCFYAHNECTSHYIIFFHLSLLTGKMNLGIGVRNGTSSLEAISKHTTAIYLKHIQKKTMTIEMLFTLCMPTSAKISRHQC
jgi:protein-ribulosamine 3-kinase